MACGVVRADGAGRSRSTWIAIHARMHGGASSPTDESTRSAVRQSVVRPVTYQMTIPATAITNEEHSDL